LQFVSGLLDAWLQFGLSFSLAAEWQIEFHIEVQVWGCEREMETGRVLQYWPRLLLLLVSLFLLLVCLPLRVLLVCS